MDINSINNLLYMFASFVIVVYMIKLTYHIYIKYKIHKMTKIHNEKDNSFSVFFIDKNKIDILPKSNDICEYVDKILFGTNNILDINDSYGFQRLFDYILNKNIEKLHICVESYGGCVFENDIIVKNLLDYDGTIETYIPNYAFSAASIISLCGHNINMGNSAVLGPTDPIDNINNMHVSVNSLMKMKTNYCDKLDSSMLIRIIDSEKAYYENVSLMREIFKRHIDKSLTGKNLFKKKMCHLFGSGEISHGLPFTKKFLLKKGLLIGKNNINYWCEIMNIIKKIY